MQRKENKNIFMFFKYSKFESFKNHQKLMRLKILKSSNPWSRAEIRREKL
jgi:hypothetical protein